MGWGKKNQKRSGTNVPNTKLDRKEKIKHNKRDEQH
jgi:hypothetical protein